MTPPWRRPWSIGVFVACVACGAGLVAANLTSAGSDLRPAGGDIASVLQDRSRTAAERQDRVARLQAEVEELTGELDSAELDAIRARNAELAVPAGFTEVTGPGVRIVMTDAPRSSDASGIDPNLLVVHQQDLQAVVNALWAGGAEAITLQGKRLISTTGIKCVGNTVVLDGVPYSPPYDIRAVGDPFLLTTALDASSEVATYVDYAERYGLGHDRDIVDQHTLPAYTGFRGLDHAS